VLSYRCSAIGIRWLSVVEANILTKLVKKILFALEHGTEMAWLLDPDEEVIFIYRVNQALQICDRPEQILPMPSFATALQLTIQTIFGWLSE
jgi:Uma2 family endonuclease